MHPYLITSKLVRSYLVKLNLVQPYLISKIIVALFDDIYINAILFGYI